MNILIFIFIFLFGAIIGSFLNVVIFRFNTGKNMVTGRSICMTCSHTLRWYELIPIFSYLFQLGKCRSCAERISHQYPLVEFMTGIIFVLIIYHFIPILFFSSLSYLFLIIFFLFLFSLLIVIAVYDFRHKIIPDALVYTFSFIGFLSIFINSTSFGPLFILPSFSSIIAGPLLALPFALLWLLSRGKWMGLGDAKLMLGLGWMLGLYLGFSVVILSFWIGAIVSLTVMFSSRYLFNNKIGKMNMKTEIPFAPFLIVSTFIVFLFNLDIFTLVRLFQF